MMKEWPVPVLARSPRGATASRFQQVADPRRAIGNEEFGRRLFEALL